MIAFGCLAPVVLAVIGVLLGNYLAGMTGALWGLAIGLVGGGAILGVLLAAVRQTKE